MTISTEDCEFSIDLGECIAALRKAHSVTQVQLAEALGVSQQTFQTYEVGRLRIPVSALPVVAKVLDVTLNELFVIGRPAVCGKRGPASQLERSIERIGELPRQKQRFVMEMQETVLHKPMASFFSLAAKKEAVPETAREAAGWGRLSLFKKKDCRRGRVETWGQLYRVCQLRR